MNYVLDYIMVPIQLIIIFFTLYYFCLSIVSIWRKKEIKHLVPKNSFAIVVAAHNEERVIGQLIENLFMLDYPRELYDVFVVADNCTDMTAQIARQRGATVFERFNNEERGKGYALEWMFTKLFKMERQYDAVVIFDADNLVATNFLTEMNSRLCKGEKCIQGYLDAKNPFDTWVSAAFAIAFWVINRMWHLGKYNLGLSTALGGTGMCIATDILKTHGWGATCLTEDLEFSMKALLKGVRTTWAHEAVVYDEKPLTFKQSWNQRKRWAQGHVDVASRYMFKLLVEGIRQRNIMILDGVIHLFQPYFLMLTTLFVIVSYIHAYHPVYTPIFYVVLPVQVWGIITLVQYVYPFIALMLERVSWKTYFYLLVAYPVFMYSWIPITFLGFLNRHNREWSHTLHTRGISYKEIIFEKVGKESPNFHES